MTKYTFIILDKKSNIDLSLFKDFNQEELGKKALEMTEMVGDINLFFHPYLEPDEAERQLSSNIHIGTNIGHWLKS